MIERAKISSTFFPNAIKTKKKKEEKMGNVIFNFNLPYRCAY